MSVLTKLAPYSKFIIALLGAVSVALTTFAGGAHWANAIISLISAVLVYIVPNKPKPSVSATQDVHVVTPHP